MGLNLNSFSDGYKKLKNEKNYTLEGLLAALQTTEFSIGKPSIATADKSPAIVFEPKDNLVVYVTVSPKDIIISRLPVENIESHVIDTMLDLEVTNTVGTASASADRGVNEVYEVVKSLMENGIAVNSNAKAAAYKLYMKQKFFSIRDKFSIFKEDETPVYWIQGNLVGLSFKMSDNDGKELLEIKKKLIAVLPEFSFHKNGQKTGTLKKKLTLTRPEVVGTLNGKQISVTGDLTGYHFSIKANGNIIGNVDSERWHLSDVYSIEIMEPEEEELVVAIAVLVDILIAAAEKKEED